MLRERQLGRHIRFVSRAVPPSTLARSHIVNSYIPQVGYLFDRLYAPGMYERESTARQSSSTAKKMKMKSKLSEQRQRSPSPLV